MTFPKPAPNGTKDAATALYRQAWSRYEALCLWNLRKADAPIRTDFEETAKALRAHGDLDACLLADRLKGASVAA